MCRPSPLGRSQTLKRLRQFWDAVAASDNSIASDGSGREFGRKEVAFEGCCDFHRELYRFAIASVVWQWRHFRMKNVKGHFKLVSGFPWLFSFLSCSHKILLLAFDSMKCRQSTSNFHVACNRTFPCSCLFASNAILVYVWNCGHHHAASMRAHNHANRQLRRSSRPKVEYQVKGIEPMLWRCRVQGKRLLIVLGSKRHFAHHHDSTKQQIQTHDKLCTFAICI